MQIGRKIYYDKLTGNILVDTGERIGSVVETTIEQDFQTFIALTERVPETVGVIELPYGHRVDDFVQSTSYRINPETQEIIFDFTPQVIEERNAQTAMQKQIDDLTLLVGDLMLGVGA